MHSVLTLKPGKEKSLLRGHPWIFSGAIGRTAGALESGATVAVRAADGQFLAWAAVSPSSQIRARVWSFDEAELPGGKTDGAFFGARIRRALALRQGVISAPHTNALRLIHGEADGLPGLIVDRYDHILVAQFLASGAEHNKSAIVAELIAQTGCPNVYERSDADVRALEDLPPVTGLLAGHAPAGPVEIIENDIRYGIDIAAGHKTGFYLDQRDSRARMQQLGGGEVLNCFCYTGGFSLAALKAGATRVLSIDSSADALAMAAANLTRNGLDAARAEWLCADVFKTLRTLRDEGRQFDTIILDPPKFAPTAAHVEKAARAYKDINLLGFKLLRPGGRLFTFSCSGGVSADLFQKIIAGAATDAEASAHITDRLGAGADHPMLLSFPEGEYLKGLVLRKFA